MSVASVPSFKYGRSKTSRPVVVEEPDLRDPAVVRSIIAEATKVARAEQKKRRAAIKAVSR